MKKLIQRLIFITLFVILIPVSVSAAEGYLVKLKEGALPDCISDIEPISIEGRMYYAKDESELELLREYISEMSPNTDVGFPEDIIEPMLFSSDRYYSEQWNLNALRMDGAWEYETYGNDVKVAVIDSGCNVNHPDLKENVLPGENYYVTVDHGFGDFSDISADDVSDNNGHGTHVSGIIAAVCNNSIGVSGIAPKAKIVPLKCFEPDYNTSTLMLAHAICDAVDEYNCRIINMSWTISVNNSLLKSALDYAYSKGAILVAAAGNDALKGNPIMYPAYYPNVISVAATDSNNNIATFSEYNDGITVAAPGVYVISTYKGHYAYMSGTSQATPAVAALAALALSASPGLTNAEFKELITSTAHDLGDDGYDVYFGYGLADGGAMMDKLTSGEGYISPINYDFGMPYVFIKNTDDVSHTYMTGIVSHWASAMTACNFGRLTLAPGESDVIICEAYRGDLAAFLWMGDNLRPLFVRYED